MLSPWHKQEVQTIQAPYSCIGALAPVLSFNQTKSAAHFQTHYEVCPLLSKKLYQVTNEFVLNWHMYVSTPVQHMKQFWIGRLSHLHSINYNTWSQITFLISFPNSYTLLQFTGIFSLSILPYVKLFLRTFAHALHSFQNFLPPFIPAAHFFILKISQTLHKKPLSTY